MSSRTPPQSAPGKMINNTQSVRNFVKDRVRVFSVQLMLEMKILVDKGPEGDPSNDDEEEEHVYIYNKDESSEDWFPGYLAVFTEEGVTRVCWTSYDRLKKALESAGKAADPYRSSDAPPPPPTSTSECVIKIALRAIHTLWKYTPQTLGQGVPMVKLTLEGGQDLPPFLFYNGGVREFFTQMRALTPLHASPDDPDLFYVNDFSRDMLSRSFHIVEPATPPSATGGGGSGEAAAAQPPVVVVEQPTQGGGLTTGVFSLFSSIASTARTTGSFVARTLGQKKPVSSISHSVTTGAVAEAPRWVDAAVQVNKWYYLFQGDRVFRYNAAFEQEADQPIAQCDFQGIPAGFHQGIDAALKLPGDAAGQTPSSLVLFCGPQYVRLSDLRTVDPGYPRPVAQLALGLPPLFSGGVEAASTYAGHVYLFARGVYARLSARKGAGAEGWALDKGYPVDLGDAGSGWNLGSLGPVKAVLSCSSGKRYFFGERQYLRMNEVVAELGYPKDLPGGWHDLKPADRSQLKLSIGSFQVMDNYSPVRRTTVDPMSVPMPSRTSGLDEVTFIGSFDSEGKISVEHRDQIRNLVFSGGCHPTIRREVWKYLLGLYRWDSTHEEREVLQAKRQAEYQVYKNQWLSITPEQETRFRKFRNRRHIIERDVLRTDRSEEYYAAADPIADNNVYCRGVQRVTDMLHDILLSYAHFNFDCGYCQGMNDYLAPLLQEVDDEVEAFWLFKALMDRVHTFFAKDQSGMHGQLRRLSALVQLLDPEFYAYLESIECANFHFCFRWLLLMFKRELNEYEAIKAVWETIWSCAESQSFQLFVAVAMLKKVRDHIMEQRLLFDGLLLLCNRMGKETQVDYPAILVSATHSMRFFNTSFDAETKARALL